MRIHALRLGTVSLVPNEPRAGAEGDAVATSASAGRTSSGKRIEYDISPLLRPFPVWGYLVEGEDGLTLVDTGPGVYASGEPAAPRRGSPRVRFKYALRLTAAPEDAISARLAALGFRRTDLQRVLLTHLHPDHAGGMHEFRDTPIFVGRREYEHARRVPDAFGVDRWPEWFSPHLVDLSGPAVGRFRASHAVSRGGQLVFVPTFGHTVGHLAVLARSNDRCWLMAGDAAFSAETLESQRLVGMAEDARAGRETLSVLRAWVRETGGLLLTGHDPKAEQRLAQLPDARGAAPA